jgi:hypothetical protein
VIADNLATDKTQLVQGFLEEHPNVHMHFTPALYSAKNASGARRPTFPSCGVQIFPTLRLAPQAAIPRALIILSTSTHECSPQ